MTTPGTTTETLRVSEPRDLLSVVPFQLGFTPTDSLVLISLRGPRCRLGLVMRVDLPPPGSTWPAGFVGRLVDHLVADGASRALAALYCDDPRSSALSPTGALEQVLGGLRAAGLDVTDAWHVGRERYRSLVCEQGCCPVEGWPVEELRSSRVGAEMVYRGLAVAARREDLVGDLTPQDAQVRAAVELAAARAGGSPAGASGPNRSTSVDRLAALAAWRTAVAGTVDGAGPAAGTCASEQSRAHPWVPGTGWVGAGWVSTAGLLLAGLADVVVRDAVMLECVPGAGHAADELVRLGAAGARAVEALDGVFSARRPVRPDAARLEAAGELLRALVRVATGPRAAPPLAMLAWASWWSGDGARAGDFAELALAADPRHSLAVLLRDCAERGVAPGWAARDRVDDLGDRVRGSGQRPPDGGAGRSVP